MNITACINWGPWRKLGLTGNDLSGCFLSFGQRWNVAESDPEYRKSYFLTDAGYLEALVLNSPVELLSRKARIFCEYHNVFNPFFLGICNFKQSNKV